MLLTLGKPKTNLCRYIPQNPMYGSRVLKFAKIKSTLCFNPTYRRIHNESKRETVLSFINISRNKM